MPKPTIRTKVISFAKGYEEEFKYVMKLDNGSKWICEAIREKRLKEKKTEDRIDELAKKLETLERKIKSQPVVYQNKPIEQNNIIIDNDTEEELAKVVGVFEF